jgi:MYXO-CTERM domain-containing protein
MKRTTFGSTLALLAAPALVVLAPAAAHAESCTSDTDCAHGMVCEITGATACAGVACPAGATCPEPPPCEPEYFKECVPGPCVADSDCAAGLVCITNTYTMCTMSACAPGTECPPETCVDQTESRCAPPYVAPCQVDADCGDGFTCEAGQMCSCSGGAAVPPIGSGGATSGTGTGTAGAPAEECTCEPSGENYCQPRTFACTTSQNCPTDWTCEGNPVAVDCLAPTGVAGAPSVDCGTTPGIAEMVCVPPYWGGAISVGYAKGSAELGSEPAAPYAAPTGSSGSQDSGGCQVSPGGARSGFGMLIGLGALALVLSRRRSRA